MHLRGADVDSDGSLIYRSLFRRDGWTREGDGILLGQPQCKLEKIRMVDADEDNSHMFNQFASFQLVKRCILYDDIVSSKNPQLCCRERCFFPDFQQSHFSTVHNIVFGGLHIFPQPLLLHFPKLTDQRTEQAPYLLRILLPNANLHRIPLGNPVDPLEHVRKLAHLLRCESRPFPAFHPGPGADVGDAVFAFALAGEVFAWGAGVFAR